ncbi:MAG: deoxyribodipyrimidine photo-lyase/cryptochrome family protein [Panacagrimonas sp.]
MIEIVWFKRDLRLHDHRPLLAASIAGKVLPLYVIEPDYWLQADASQRHWQFIRECLLDLRAALAARGQPLVLRQGEITEVLDALRQGYGAIRLWSHQETGNGWTYARDLRVADWCRGHGVEWTELPQTGVIRRLRTREGWASRWEQRMSEVCAPPPTALTPLSIEIGEIPSAQAALGAADACPLRQRGGRRAAEQVLQSFLHERGERYHRDLSSPLTAARGCSRLSAHLAWGSLSVREVVRATSARLQALSEMAPSAAGTWPRALRAFVSRLHWHCHFMQKLESEPEIEFDNFHRAYDGLRETEFSIERFEGWRSGRTGLPFVDACMRSLIASGWINFRMRAMLISVASYQLWLHWREPALHLARLFTDYEPGIHYPQVQMQSGVTGINTLRIYNPIKQGLDQDPDAAFIRRWVPELARVPLPHVHEPWKLGAAEQAALGRKLEYDYPLPIVDPIAAARAARDRIWTVRRDPAFGAQADEVQERHGSRKAGLPSTTRPRRRPDAGQLKLEF